ncbi:[FeFe] hydrogenase H-cluster radical SAM maturase HydG [Clostridium perfringens]|jgi:2-iminoacetate synthase|uniref:[FeFe] hydrogenase H-cluster radical SAM maturase HydG n=1 Tax=Clostridium perfringens TaxID=1502 RepID=A0AAE8FQN7_CLOPF|nr:[FeFe] hydrogenase H-cluster radical SAM maturase HydG [Clostridium perfringens]EJT5932001.1 [FeFe] hydrogenase H-cluster radical SAM maturase HydG [Clostridium perfringens]EJT6163264.1 [FeFe] hydrogenase H-cluster radical SAM maturase HydG [Clostridium perfringens]EJT6505748.1 [FeFe] hydrogenase H-cluster radical SAM maturase HydG [Clostridium perfringens]MBI6057323.1 [FeFe] hydrogenase H-cluster radical SAM maturase HydG [Clostridium perfringens]MCC5434331.1 [FeFe] hydrogenase H-cluster r
MLKDNEKYNALDFIKNDEINSLIAKGKELVSDKELVREIIEKSKSAEGLTPEETAVLLNLEDKELIEEMFKAARQVKEKLYGKRLVVFAPLYVSNYCVNNCTYCGYKYCNDELKRKKLNKEQLIEEVKVLESLGHKRIALEAGEDPVNAPLDYILDCIKSIYSIKFDNGSIRRINVNIAATTVENYKRLKDAEIGTYILFQETYHKPTYERLHVSGPKHNYNYHTTAMHRAREAGIDDIGMGVLYGLYDYKYETLAMLMHAMDLEETTGVGPHTLSVPRIRPAENVSLENYPYLVDDEDFKKIVAILRLAVPYAGLILSTREEPGLRDEIIALGVSQVSTGSCTGVGGYSESYVDPEEKPQFEVGDHRSPVEMIESLMEAGYIPSYCTACYREGRTGERFMEIVKSGELYKICEANALITLKEFIDDYGTDKTREIGDKLIKKSIDEIDNESFRKSVEEKINKISKGTRDLRF